jgi:hypothetical protein
LDNTTAEDSEKGLLSSRPLAPYWGLGVSTPEQLAAALVTERFKASREVAVRYLYERVLEDSCDTRKLTNAEKKVWRGVDFRKDVGPDVYLVNLKSARATSNSDISKQTMENLSKARAAERNAREALERSGDDNPLGRRTGRVVAVRAIARGVAAATKRTRSGEEVEILVGDRLWEQLGAGPGFGRQIQLEMGRKPIDVNELEASLRRAEERVIRELSQAECIRPDGTLDWPCLLEKFPDV